MSNAIDLTKLNTEDEIEVAKGKIRDSIRIQEEQLSNSLESLKINFFNSLKKTAWKMGINLAVIVVIKIVQWKLKKRSVK